MTIQPAVFFSLLLASLSLPSFSLTPPSEKFRAADWAVLHSSRSDQRHVSSRGIVQTMLEKLRPACEFSPDMAPKDFPAWREKVRKAMQQLMKFPPQADIPAPVLVKTVPREHYRVEKWEAYPFPGAAVPFLVLLPNNASDKNPVPVLFCIPGSDQTKEELAGETSPDLDQPSVQQPGNNAMAFHYVRQGWAAIVVDNAGTGEEGDAEHAAGRSSHDYENLARFLLEMDWSWLGYTSYADQCILDWVKTRPWAQKNHIILSGFSLGTEPMMVLGSLNPDIFAFVYNDFLCRTLERAKTMTMPNGRGVPLPTPSATSFRASGNNSTSRTSWRLSLRALSFARKAAWTGTSSSSPQPTVWSGRRIISSTITSPGLRTLPNAGTAANCPQVWTGTPFSVSPMWTRATISSKKTWSFPGLKPSWIKAIIKTSLAPDKNRPEPPEQDIPSSLGMRIYPAAHLPECMPQLSAKARHRPGAPFHVHELK